MIYWEILDKTRKELFAKLSIVLGADHYLAGGTALALQIGHRESLDFDVFQDKAITLPLKTKLFRSFKSHSPQTLVDTADELTFILAGKVKVTILDYYWPPLFPLVKTKGVLPLLSIKDIAVTKAYALGRRANYRDYFDLYVLVKKHGVSLKEIVRWGKKKYGDVFSERMFLEQLTYCDDLEKDIKLRFLREKFVPPAAIASFFTSEIKRFSY